MRLKVLQYEGAPFFHHLCETKSGRKIRVDLMVDGAFSERKPEDLVGLTVECNHLYPYILLASGLKVVTEGEAR